MIRNLRKKINLFKKSISIIGLTGLLKRFLYSFHEEILMVLDLADLKMPVSKNNLEIQRLEREHFPAIEKLCKEAVMGGTKPLKYINKLFENGFMGFVGIKNQEIIGYLWFGNRDAQYNVMDYDFKFYAKDISLAAGEAYGFDLLLSPRYRRNGYALEFFTKCLRAPESLGYKTSYSFVLKKNLQARWLYAQAGFRELRKIKVRRFLLFFLFKNNKFYFDRNGHNWLFETHELNMGSL